RAADQSSLPAPTRFRPEARPDARPEATRRATPGSRSRPVRSPEAPKITSVLIRSGVPGAAAGDPASCVEGTGAEGAVVLVTFPACHGFGVFLWTRAQKLGKFWGRTNYGPRNWQSWVPCAAKGPRS